MIQFLNKKENNNIYFDIKVMKIKQCFVLLNFSLLTQGRFYHVQLGFDLLVCIAASWPIYKVVASRNISEMLHVMHISFVNTGDIRIVASFIHVFYMQFLYLTMYAFV